MTPEQIRIVQTTWLKVLPIKDAAARLFYDRLFDLDPSLKRLFRGDMRGQGQKLMQVIDAAVNGLNQFDRVRPLIQALGRRHAGYGVKDEHYGTVGTALLWTLAKSLGAEFTPAVRDAWSAAYGTLATTMREAAQGEPGPRAQGVKPHERAADAPAPREASMRDTRGISRRERAVYAVLVLVFAAVLGGLVHLSADGAPPRAQSPRDTAPAANVAAAESQEIDTPQLLLEALLAPALDTAATPWRWVDPRQAMRCGAGTTVQVNGAPLVAGAAAPVMPFEVQWHAQACRPFGRFGPRFDGHVKFTVYREDWGYSTTIEPMKLRVIFVAGKALQVAPVAISAAHAAESAQPM